MKTIDSVPQSHTRKLDGTLREIQDIPEGLPVRALFLLKNDLFLTGVIAEDGMPRIYDYGRKRYLIRENWNGIVFWMMLPG